MQQFFLALFMSPLGFAIFIFLGSIVAGILDKPFPSGLLVEIFGVVVLLEFIAVGIYASVRGAGVAGYAILFFALLIFLTVVVRLDQRE